MKTSATMPPGVLRSKTRRRSGCRQLMLAVCMFALHIMYSQDPQVERIRVEEMRKGTAAVCGASEDQLLFYNQQHQAARASGFNQAVGVGTPQPLSPIGAFLPSQIQRCGMFRVYYEDDLFPTPSFAGFADPGTGAARKNTMCAVLGYIGSVFAIQDTIDIHVNRSYSSVNPAGAVTFLAFAGPVYPAGYNTTPGIYDGYFFDHATTGADPDPADYDAEVTVNFDTFQYWNDSTNTSATCVYDLYSVLLHEVQHAMGWISFVREDIAPTYYAKTNTNNGFSRYDWTFLYYYPSTFSSPTKLVTGTVSSPTINPTVNGFPTPLRTNKIWLSNSSAPYNQPVFSGNLDNAYFNTPGSILSHLDLDVLAFPAMAQFSPGFMPRYVIGAFMSEEEQRRHWTLQEIRAMMTLGYALNPTFAASTSLNGTDVNSTLLSSNAPAFRSNFATVPVTKYVSQDQDFPENQTIDFTLVNNNTISSPGLSSILIDLSTDPNVADPNGDPVRIMDGSLVGFRGCSLNGNNHGRLSVNSGSTQITYTPEPGYIGRAQFGFFLYDGHEQGGFKIYTIDVQPGSWVVTPGNELVINGSYEDGVELRQRGLNESFFYSPRRDGFIEGEYFSGSSVSGAHPYNYYCNFWNLFMGGATMNNWKNCYFPGSFTKGAWGYPTASWDNLHFGSMWFPETNAATTPNERYSFMYGTTNISTLINPMQNCHYYNLEFDVNFYRTGLALGQTFDFTLQALGVPQPNPSGLNILDTKNFTVTVTNTAPNGWQHVAVSFFYCGQQPSRYINLICNNPLGILNSTPIDNLSLTENLSPPPLTVSITGGGLICAGSSATLTAVPLNVACSPLYSWAPVVATTESIVVTPSVTTSYTVGVKDGCRSAGAVTTVSVGAAVSLTISPSKKSLCLGQSMTLVGSGASSYTWQPGNIVANPIVVGPSSTTIYTLTGESPGSCVGTQTFQVNVYPYPIVTASASPTLICAGQQSTLTASGALSYSWNPGGSISNPYFVNPSTTTTYTVIGKGQGNCADTATVTVYVNPTPTITTSGDTTICTGQSVTVSASGGTTYTWQPGGATGSPIVVSPGSTTIYTVTGETGGCTSTATMQVTVTTCTGCTVCTDISGTGVISTSPPVGGVYCINNSVVISGAVNFALSEFKIAPNVTITVSSGSSLNILGSHLYSCGDMWQGIVMRPNSTMTVNQFSQQGVTRTPLIEDAIVAIDITSHTSTSTILTVNESIFNRNRSSIKITGYTQSIATYPFKITSTLFTCRDLPFTQNSLVWPQTAAVKVATTSNAGYPLTNQYIVNTTYLQTGAAATLKAPFAGAKPANAIDLNKVGVTLNAGTTSPTYYEFAIGVANTVNVFDNMTNCVNLLNSNFSTVNNVYQNTTARGIGINAISESTFNNRMVVSPSATGNKFADCGRGIVSRDYFEHIIQGNDFRTSQVNNAPLLSNKFGVQISTNRYRVCNVSANSIYNVEQGIFVNANYGAYNVTGTPVTSGQYAGAVNIDKNVIQPQVPSFLQTTQYIYNAIVLQNVVASGLQFANSIVPVISASNNTLTNVFRGINYTNWRKENSITNSNSIQLQSDNFAVNPTQFGISHTNNGAATSMGNSIQGNSVAGYGLGNPNTKGIYTSVSDNQVVKCNNTKNTANGIEFSGSNLPTTFFLNTMQLHTYGYVLNNTGVIGVQGNSVTPCDNQWLGTWAAGTFKTATLNSSTATNSRIWVRNSGAFNPNGSGTTTMVMGVDNYYFNAGLGTILYVASPPPFQGCPTNGTPDDPSSLIRNTNGTHTDIGQASFDAVLYPNPSTGSFSIASVNLPDGPVDVSIQDMNGKVLFSQAVNIANSTAQLNADISNGVYMVLIVNPVSKEQIMKKLVIQK